MLRLPIHGLTREARVLCRMQGNVHAPRMMRRRCCQKRQSCPSPGSQLTSVLSISLMNTPVPAPGSACDGEPASRMVYVSGRREISLAEFDSHCYTMSRPVRLRPCIVLCEDLLVMERYRRKVKQISSRLFLRGFKLLVSMNSAIQILQMHCV